VHLVQAEKMKISLEISLNNQWVVKLTKLLSVMKACTERIVISSKNLTSDLGISQYEEGLIMGLSEFEQSIRAMNDKKYSESENYLKEALKILK
jgi:hypothetical protein